MSQHYLKCHLKSFIHNINNKATADDDNNGNNVDTETDMMNGNVKHFNCQQQESSTGKIRITENPLPENILHC
jgi:hypothetical protein